MPFGFANPARSRRNSGVVRRHPTCPEWSRLARHGGGDEPVQRNPIAPGELGSRILDRCRQLQGLGALAHVARCSPVTFGENFIDGQPRSTSFVKMR